MERDDPDVVEADLRANLAEFDVTIIKGDLRKVHEQVGPVQFLHLDADHWGEMTEAAFDLYGPKVETQGFLALHDAYGDWHDTVRFAEYLASDPDWQFVDKADRAAVFQRS